MKLGNIGQLYTQQTQKLSLNHSLIQSLGILQMNSIELFNLVKQEMLDNPVIDTVKSEGQKADDKVKMDSDVYYDYHGKRYNPDEDSINPFEKIAVLDETLTEHLLSQLKMTPVDDDLRKVCETIISALEEDGYLRLSDEELTNLCGADEDMILDGISVIQQMDPVGVASRSLEENLKAQLVEVGLLDGRMCELLENHLEDIASNKIAVIAKALEISTSEAQQAVDVVKSLNPRPGSSFASKGGKTQFIFPEIVVERDGDELNVSMVDGRIPSICINEDYKSMYAAQSEGEAKEYLKERIGSASQLISSIKQRRMTILRVATAIIERQRDFFLDGKGHMKQLTMKEIAEELDIHESTVSRAVNGKYLQCDRGSFELKYFFSSGLTGKTEGDLSQENIKEKISEIIKEESKERPLSDQKISGMLENEGIHISRRTVAKYREEMGIPATSKRKRY